MKAWRFNMSRHAFIVKYCQNSGFLSHSAGKCRLSRITGRPADGTGKPSRAVGRLADVTRKPGGMMGKFARLTVGLDRDCDLVADVKLLRFSFGCDQMNVCRGRACPCPCVDASKHAGRDKPCPYNSRA